MSLSVLYTDNHLLVVNKPPGLLSQGDRTGDVDVLTLGKAYVKSAYDKPGNVYLGLVHRLDRPASGAMVLARTSKAAARLSAQFRERTVRKDYLAVVGGFPGEAGSWTDFIAKDRERVRIVKPAHRGALEASLTWKAVAADRGWTLVHVRLETGRPHQVRVQFAHRGFPIIGDFRYGSTTELDGKNLALHCVLLALDHPTRRTAMQWVAPLPDTWPEPMRASAAEPIRNLSAVTENPG